LATLLAPCSNLLPRVRAVATALDARPPVHPWLAARFGGTSGRVTIRFSAGREAKTRFPPDHKTIKDKFDDHVKHRH
jgi:hypothetical protein